MTTHNFHTHWLQLNSEKNNPLYCNPFNAFIHGSEYFETFQRKIMDKMVDACALAIRLCAAENQRFANSLQMAQQPVTDLYHGNARALFDPNYLIAAQYQDKELMQECFRSYYGTLSFEFANLLAHFWRVYDVKGVCEIAQGVNFENYLQRERDWQQNSHRLIRQLAAQDVETLLTGILGKQYHANTLRLI